MRCSKCGKLNLKAPKKQTSIKCVFCGAIFQISETPKPKASPAKGIQISTDIKAAAATSPQRPRFVNDRYALAPNPRSGGMAFVYKANDMLNDNNQVAVKVLRHGSIEAPILDEVFKRETQALKELDHEGIVKLFDSGTDQETGEYFLVFEWVNSDLSQLL